jgi:Ca2+-binding EF-hand superfamily protein
MGAGVGVEASANVPDDILNLFRECEDEQNKIAERDLSFLTSQSKQMWKNHKKIISVITQKSKSQLRRMVNLQKSNSGAFATQLKDMLGGAYGDFVRFLVCSKADIDAELLRSALGCIGCDEVVLVSSLCTNTPEESKAIKDKYNDAGAVDLDQKIFGKLDKNSPFQRFMHAVVKSNRDSDRVFDASEAVAQMEQVYANCNDSTPEKDDDTFALLCRISRAQCSLLNTEMVQTHNVTLDVMFKRKFKGICATALKLWTSPRDEAIAQVLHDVLHDDKEEYDVLAGVLAKYDKLHVKNIASKYELLFGENLVGRVEQVIAGNFKLAVVSWLTTFSFDGFKEEAIAKIISDRFGSLSAAMSDSDTADTIRTELINERDALVAFNYEQGLGDSAFNARPEPVKLSLPPIGSEKRISAKHKKKSEAVADSIAAKLDQPPDAAAEPLREEPASSPDEKRVAFASVEETPPPAAEVKETPPPQIETEEDSGPAPLLSMKSPSIRHIAPNKDDFERKWNMTCEFLKESFAIFDKDKSGYLESAEFWSALRSFQLGYTEDEIAGMVQWTDWDCDGMISYDEVVNELAESVINIIEGRGGNVERELADIKSRIKRESEELYRMESEGGLSPNLVQYLKDSFQAYDLDDNGSLSAEEFWRVLNVVLVETINGLKEAEIMELRVMLN